MYNWSIGGSMLNKGTYFISLLTEQGRKTLKVLKSRGIFLFISRSNFKTLII